MGVGASKATCPAPGVQAWRGCSPHTSGYGNHILEVEALLRYPVAPWGGWGCSLAWLGKALATTMDPEAWSDLLFTTDSISVSRLWPQHASPYMAQAVPGLGLSIARYNVGGSGRVEDQAGEARSKRSRGWYAEIEGFQPFPEGDFDWSRDEGQRSFLGLAVERGVDQVEIFANAPMWWMTNSHSSFGGNLVQPDEFAAYLAEVVAQARSSWGVPVRSVAPFNEPSAGWWRFPHGQEGCNIPHEQQVQVIMKLRDELDRRGLSDVVIAVSDENRPSEAISTWHELRRQEVIGYVGCLNVHSYDGLDPWKEAEHPGERSCLRRLASQDAVPIIVSEHGTGDTNGLDLASTILEDLHYLEPSAWCYWQPVEHRSPWGLVEAHFSPNGSRSMAMPFPKHYVLAHFSRFLRPGFQMLRSTQPWAAMGYSPEEATIVCVLQNTGNDAVRARLKFSAFSAQCGPARQAVVTQPLAGRFFVETHAQVHPACVGFELILDMPPQSVASAVVGAVELQGTVYGATESVAFSIAHVVELVRSAACATTSERVYGSDDVRTLCCWQRWEHAYGCAVTAAGHSGEAFMHTLKEMVLAAAWGVANERKYGADNEDTRNDWSRFENFSRGLAQANAVLGGTSDVSDLKWMVFNLSWAVANERWYGVQSPDHREALQLATAHLCKAGGGLWAVHIQDMARAAASAACNERSFGLDSEQTKAAWETWEHAKKCANAAAGAGEEGSSKEADCLVERLLETILAAAWGAVNQRHFGTDSVDAAVAWTRFGTQADALIEAGLAVDIKWMIFNTCWAVVNERWYGTNSPSHREAEQRATQHLWQVGVGKVVLCRAPNAA
mmetsp:Transcript_49485/g.117777  ORF Transcript_49485/g.117777 Transcript_49485/m.117777 type:complete len:839 (-) Transcript_49485:83-2599(-)